MTTQISDRFDEQVAPYRRELHAHCYRMLGSAHDADDVLQNTLLRAWRGLPSFAGRSSLRTWLYTIATRCCLDVAALRRRALPMDLGPASPEPLPDDDARADVAWLGPYPDAPDALVEQREAIELAFVAALQHLPGNQRAALLLGDVLLLPAAEIAEALGTSVASVNSALQRARATLADRAPERSQQQALRTLGDAALTRLVDEFAAALERGDADRLVGLLSRDVTWSMPPLPGWYSGHDAVAAFVRAVPLGSCGTWRARRLTANAQPALALYLDADGRGRFLPWSVNVLGLDGAAIGEVTSFVGAEHFAAFGLPAELTAERSEDPR